MIFGEGIEMNGRKKNSFHSFISEIGVWEEVSRKFIFYKIFPLVIK